MQEYNVRNLIISNFIKEHKNQPPNIYMRDYEFIKKFQRIIIDVLDNPKITVFLKVEGSDISTYGGPFTLKNEKFTHGYCVISENTIWSLHAYKEESLIRSELLNRAIKYMNNPPEVFVPHPSKWMWNVLKDMSIKENFKIKFPWGYY